MFAFSHNLFQVYTSTVSRYKTSWSSIVVDFLWYNHQGRVQVILKITKETELDFGPGNSKDGFYKTFHKMLQLGIQTDGSTCQQMFFLLANKCHNFLLKQGSLVFK